MSHSVALVLAPKNVLDYMTPEDFIGKQLAPYNEEIKVDPYDENCYCVGNVARKKIHDQLESEMPIEEIRKKNIQYCKDHNLEDFGKESEKSWKEFIKPYKQREAELTASQEGLNDPNPNCKDCKGTRIVQSTYNPDSKWDGYMIGGRWTGYLRKEKPENNPKNFETCMICGGTGDRHDACPDEENQDPWVTYVHEDTEEVLSAKDYSFLVVAEVEHDKYKRTFKNENAEHCNGCNGCQGTGKRIKWILEPSINDQMPLKNLPLDDPEAMKDLIPFAIVTPDGKWYEHGSMGWWGIVSDEKDTWKEEALEILKKHRDCVAIVVDCHI
jgi:hypothetical protein